MNNVNGFSWHPTTAPPRSSAYGRYDDVFFVDSKTGWCVGSDGQAHKTIDGGGSWTTVFQLPHRHRRLYLRTVAFANREIGWIGALDVPAGGHRPEPGTAPEILFHTRNGGSTWQPMPLPAGTLTGICGLSVVDEHTVYVSGTLDPGSPAGVLKTVDSGQHWQVCYSSVPGPALADVLIDVYFPSRLEGWVVGGKSGGVRSTCAAYRRRSNAPDAALVPVVLHTTDGGKTWTDRVADVEFPPGEWGWKIHFVNDRLGFVSLENLCEAAILKTLDGGRTWERFPVAGNNDLEGIGFVDEENGWVGGWGFDLDHPTGLCSGSTDGGKTWSAMTLCPRINRFRFLGDPVEVGYAAGSTIWKYSAEAPPTPAPPVDAEAGMMTAVRPRDDGRVVFDYQLPAADRVSLIVWTHHGKRVRVLVDGDDPSGGRRSTEWDGADRDGHRLAPGAYIYRLTAGDRAESAVFVKRS